MTDSFAMLQVVDHDTLLEIRILVDTIVDETDIQAMDREFKSVIERRDAPKIVVNFQNVQHLSSSALGTLISLNSAIQDRGGQLCLAEINGAIQEVFKITKLDRIFAIEKTADEARASLS